MEKLLSYKGPGTATGERRPRQLSSPKALRRTGAFLLAGGVGLVTVTGCGDGGGQEVQKIQPAVNAGPVAPGPSRSPEKPKLTKPQDGGKIPMEVRIAALEKCQDPALTNVNVKLGGGAITGCEAGGSAIITYQAKRGVLVENYDTKNRFIGGMASLCVGKGLIQHSAYGGPQGGMKMPTEKDQMCKDGTLTIAEVAAS